MDSRDGMYDPLHINISSVKVEPSDVTSNFTISVDEKRLATDFLEVKMIEIQKSTDIPSDGESGFIGDKSKTRFKLAPQNEREHYDIASNLLMDIKTEIEESTWDHSSKYDNSPLCSENADPENVLQTWLRHKNIHKLNKRPLKRNERLKNRKNKLKSSRITRSHAKLSIDIKPEALESSELNNEETSNCPGTLVRKALRVKKMDENYDVIRIKTIQRKERLLRSYDHMMSMRCKPQDFNDDEKEVEAIRLTRSKTKWNETHYSCIAENSSQAELLNARKYDKHQQFVKYPNVAKLEKYRQISAAKMRERRARETPEESDARRLKARIYKMKSRLIAQLIISEEELKAENARKAEEMRLKRQKRRETETPEQTAARKLKQKLQARKSRNRLEAAETPEETAKRKAAKSAYLRKRKAELKAKETPEEQALRKKQSKEQRRLYREKNLAQKLGENPKEA